MSVILKLILTSHFLSVLIDALVQFSIILKLSNESGTPDTISIFIVQTLFFLPFIILGAFSGSLADKYSKIKIFKILKLIEIPIVYLVGLSLENDWKYLLYLLIFIKGISSSLCSPVKVGLLPELSSEIVLSKSNGVFQFLVVAGTIFGTLIAGYMLENLGGHGSTGGLSPSLLLLLISSVSFLLVFFLKNNPAQSPERQITINPLPSPELLKVARRSKPLLLTNLAISFFWALATFYKVSIILFAESELKLESEFLISILLLVLGVGLSFGSILSSRISFGRIEIGLVPIGAFLISLTSFLIASNIDGFYGSVACFFILGFSSGLFIVPLSSYFQSETDPRYLGSLLGLQNQISFSLIIFLSILIPLSLEFLGVGVRSLFSLGSISMLGITIFLLRYIPEMPIRLLNWILIRAFYKIKILGRENIPEGGALLISNHISFIDAALIQACLDRPVHFLMFKPIYENKWIHPIVSKLGAIPIDAGKKETIEEALNLAKESVRDGNLVCIFPEGGISRIGLLQPFKRGMEKIMEGLDNPIVPIYIDQLWGSIFSFKGKKFIWKLPREIPYPITISFGDKLPPNTSSSQSYLKVEEMGAEVFSLRDNISETVAYRALKSLRRSPFRQCMSDSTGLRLRAFSFLSIALIITKRLGRESTSEYICIHLPNSVISAAVNLAVQILGKVSVNLNGTASQDSINSNFQQTSSKLVITSKKYIEKLPIVIPEGVKTIFVEDYFTELKAKEKYVSLIEALILPTKRILNRYSIVRPTSSSTATILFSSGSTGTPKGVMLTHRNIISNVHSISQIFETDSSDGVLGCLPFFHSFGFTCTIWFPLLEQVKVAYHPNPLDAGQIGKLAGLNNSTILFATPTFLQLYLKKCTPEQFSHLREVMVGAEKLSEKLSASFEEKFKISPKEGYGCTELSPLALVNSSNFGKGKLIQKGIKSGTVGLPIPGVSVKIVDPETFITKSPNESGLLLVKGSNVMKGYLNNPDLTNEVIKDNWYVTGDIAIRDSEGFVTITDRLSRFSKIGGEMVPHIKIEELIQDIVGSDERICVVTGIPDEKKGERLVVLLLEGIENDDIISGLTDRGLPNLWIPKAESFKVVPSFPLLGTGKLDLAKVKDLANELF